MNMSDKQRDYSHRGGEFSYEPGKEPDLGESADVKQPPPNWQDGYTVPKDQPTDSKIKPNDRDA
jgi:hypothetical protein